MGSLGEPAGSNLQCPIDAVAQGREFDRAEQRLELNLVFRASSYRHETDELQAVSVGCLGDVE